MNFETAILSEPGSRPVNQDFAAYATSSSGECHCWALADGLGGHGGGEQAARIAAGAVLANVEHGAGCGELESLFSIANEAVVAEQLATPSLRQMRTTLVLLLATGSQAAWAHAGDSRLYHFRGSRVAAQTRDHSFAQALVDSGKIEPAAIRFHDDRSRLLRTVGAADAKPEISNWVALEEGDAFLLASDGFWELVTEREMEIEYAKSETPRQWLERMRGRVQMAPVTDRDNFSAIAVYAHAN